MRDPVIHITASASEEQLSEERLEDNQIRADISFDLAGITIGQVLLTCLGNNCYQIEESTLLAVEEATYKDVIEAFLQKDGSLRSNRVVKKSGLKNYNAILNKDLIESPEFAAFLDQIDEADGYWTIFFGGCIDIYLPKDSIIDPASKIESLYKRRSGG